MAVSTGERKRKSDGKEYETPPPLPCRPKELDVLLDKWVADGVFKPNQVSKEPTEEERRPRVSVICKIMCNTLPQNARNSTN